MTGAHRRGRADLLTCAWAAATMLASSDVDLAIDHQFGGRFSASSLLERRTQPSRASWVIDSPTWSSGQGRSPTTSVTDVSQIVGGRIAAPMRTTCRTHGCAMASS